MSVSFNTTLSSGLYYKPMTIVSDDSRVVNKLETSDDARVVIYNRRVFIVQATGCIHNTLFSSDLTNGHNKLVCSSMAGLSSLMMGSKAGAYPNEALIRKRS